MIFSRHPLEHMLLLSAVIFCCGVYTILTRKNAVSILMGVELVLNAANINFVAFSQYTRIGGMAKSARGRDGEKYGNRDRVFQVSPPAGPRRIRPRDGS